MNGLAKKGQIRWCFDELDEWNFGFFGENRAFGVRGLEPWEGDKVEFSFWGVVDLAGITGPRLGL